MAIYTESSIAGQSVVDTVLYSMIDPNIIPPHSAIKMLPFYCTTSCRWDNYYRYRVTITDTVYFCIIDANKLQEIYGRDYTIYTVNRDTAIIQRYDLTYQDLVDLNAEFSYPPDEKMKNIKMFPPYKEE